MEDNKFDDEFFTEDSPIFVEAKHKAKKYLKMAEDARNFVQEREKNLQENLAFYEGSQYELSAYKQPKPWVVNMKTPYASLAIDTRVASLIANDYKGELIPVTAKDSDSVNSLSLFVNDEWDRLNLDDMITDSIKSGAVQREGYIHTYLKDKKKIACDYIDPAMIYIDPEARKWEDAGYIIIPARENRKRLCGEFPDFENFFKNKKSTSVSPEERGEIYLSDDYTTSQDNFLTSFTIYEKKYDGKKTKINKVFIVEDMLIEEKELTDLTRFPIAQFRWRKQRTSCYGISLMDDLLSLQKAVNSIESAITNTAIAYANPTLAVREGCGLDPKKVAISGGAPGVVYKVKGSIDDAIKPIIKPSVDQTIIAIKQEYVDSIDKVAGITSQYLGSIGTSGNTAEGSKMALERSKIIEADVLRNVKVFVEEQTFILAEYVLSVYGGETIQSRTMTNNGVVFEEREIPNDITSASFNFYIDMDTKTQFSKEREKEALTQLYQMENQYNAPVKCISMLDIISQFNLSNYEEIKNRYERIEQNSADDRAELIQQISNLANQFGVNQDLLTMAIAEIINNKDETPYLDQVMQMIDEGQKNLEAQQQQVADQTITEDQVTRDEMLSQGITPQIATQAQAEGDLQQAQQGTGLADQMQALTQNAQMGNDLPQNVDMTGLAQMMQ